MDKKTIKLIAVIAGIIFALLLGIYIGKKTAPVKTITKTEYIQGETIRDSIPYPVPYKVTVPADTLKILQQCIKDGIYADLFPEKIKYVTDTVYFEKEDTTKILEDWATKREYERTLFDSDTLGTFKLNTTVQYNRISDLKYEFTPMIKTVTTTEYRVRKILPFVGAGVSGQFYTNELPIMPSIDAEAGLFFKQSWGASVNARYYINNKQYEYMPKYDFGVKVLKAF